MVDADSFRRVFGDHRRVVALGSGTSGTFLFDLYETAVAYLVVQGGFHYCGLLAGVVASLRGFVGWIEVVAEFANDPWRSVVDPDGGLHGVPLRAGEGA